MTDKKERKKTIYIPISNTMLCKKALDKCLMMTITNRNMRRQLEKIPGYI